MAYYRKLWKLWNWNAWSFYPQAAEVIIHGWPHVTLLGGQHIICFAQFFTSFPWWRLQMETYSALLAFCAGNSPVTGEFPTQRPVTQSFDIFFDLHLNELLSKQPWGWWFETPSSPLWRHSNMSDVCGLHTSTTVQPIFHCTRKLVERRRVKL